ncbi:hypothetical protein F9H41_21560 [Salmonella enterica subsp. enterica serovar Montevideo]|uniref:Uncharacterized protein n=3 Tax=Salmonella enterica TaxID=28901 RepID=A0A5I3ELZ8_SALET|nr:hypothetical protein [Salmonella enterica subsp. enterica serovar Bredeney]EAA4402053.1 hypothetical protein [Salmonella enterica subsp. enterica serovar London]EAA7354195.1 hypothetical protein [Salmonella enterica subsp. enterica]EAB7892610.1 hypothetical protein [Salmonella enterica subsp. enterica serovar Newport]EAP2626197.1 hypothetical protein [Salmonella enterica]EBW5413714.1 hypothetical protein [Salmonella enterica subsp. enterica serovar Bonn]EBY7415665.1 hypothetical protein [S
MIWTQLPWITWDMVVFLSQMQRQLHRDDTTAERKAKNAGAVSQAAAQLKSRRWAGRFDGEN